MKGGLLWGFPHYQLGLGLFTTVSYWLVCSYQSIFFHGTEIAESIR